MIRSGPDGEQNNSWRPLTKLELLKFGLVAFLGLSVVIAVLLAAFTIGLLLAVPLVLLGFFWLITLIVRGRIRLYRYRVKSPQKHHDE
jgi:hypothetical protein